MNKYFFYFIISFVYTDVAEVTALISLAIVKVFSTMLSLIIVERCGRRTALITSATICMTTISLLSLLATIDRGDDNLDVMNNHCKNHRNEEVKIHTILPTGSPPPFPLLPTPLAIVPPSPETWTQIKASCEVYFSHLLRFVSRLMAFD